MSTWSIFKVAFESSKHRGTFLYPTGRFPAKFGGGVDKYPAQYSTLTQGVLLDRGHKTRFGLPPSPYRPQGGTELPASAAYIADFKRAAVVVVTLVA